ncbi:hypothetical protein [Bradyrhizobium sp. sBnM-33]|uniref:hypothetical protein n=1 Tax=Bradyrhizobium sp. sBnM-33 TaxID=2831780 RepID=UPI0020BF392A|nr:hypothetical protein [Bradyrhizobium sp. sBnM-33]WOH53811.1 hypothetical protein RX328_17995 [Bradyrhizobium sp. sBnM-33]
MATVKLGLTFDFLGRSPSANALMAAVKGLTTMIDEKFAHCARTATILTAIIGCLKLNFQTSSASSLKGASQKINQ